MQLFYNPEITSESRQIVFDKEESRHISKVLRKSTGDILHITNGEGHMFTAKIVIGDVKNCVADVIDQEFKEPRNYKIHMAVAPTKMNERYEWFLEKATEIGVDSITPILCDHSERKIVKLERFEKIIQAATKQSLHYYMPKLNEAVSFREFVSQTFVGQKFIAHCEETDRLSFKNAIQRSSDIIIMIGPEGDFSTQEIKLALEHNFKPVMLGKTRLRTETAAVVACHSIVFANEA